MVWTVLYGLIGMAVRDVWRATPDRRGRGAFAALLGVNAALHFGWQGIFFGARRPDWALAESGAYWLSTLSLVAFASRRSQRAAALLSPYLTWVTFATALNADIAARNAPYR